MIDQRLAERLSPSRWSAPGWPGGQALWRPTRQVISVLGSLAILLLAWTAASIAPASDLPGPLSTFHTFQELARDPFADNGPSNQGIGWLVIASLERVLIGFLLGTLLAVPLGVLLGISPWARRLVDPLVQVLRPVSPLAWFPIGLTMFRSVSDATIFMILITSLWPTVLNTAFGVSNVPESHKNVARVFQFSRWKYLTRIVLPFSLSYILTGMRLSMGIAWMVIVAGEMLSGGSGIGFFVWDSWNAFKMEQVLVAILLIGGIGLALDRGFGYLVGRYSYTEVA
jgi:nitrate/nitrite transport system permease protein